MKQTKSKKVDKHTPKLNFSLKDIIIVLMILSYILILYAYKYDIKQYQDVIQNPQKLCYIYYSQLNRQMNLQNDTNNNSMIHILDIEDMKTNEIKR